MNNARQRLNSPARNLEDFERVVNGAEPTPTQIATFKRISVLPVLSLADRLCPL